MAEIMSWQLPGAPLFTDLWEAGYIAPPSKPAAK
jgi:hypothetical protein